jgi:S-formylglutathione hydrolase FrmB
MSVLSSWVIADPQTVALLLAVAAAAAVLSRVARRRTRSRRRRRVAVVVAVTVASVFSAAGVADAVNVHFGYVPRVADLVSGSWPRVPAAYLAGVGLQDWSGEDGHHLSRGGVVSVPVDGRLIGSGRSHALVYLPPQYFTEPSRRFPVLYLLHGSPGVPADWLRGGRLVEVASAVAAAGDPVIVVMPRVSLWWLDDSECVDGVHERSEHYLTSDVVASIDGRLRTIPDRRHRAIAGMSAGGYCALNVGLRHRDEFSLIVDMSGLDRPTHGGGVAALFGRGRTAMLQARAETPADYVGRLSPEPSTSVWLDCGSADGAPLTDTREMFALLRSRGIPVQLHLRPGAHTFHVWVPALRAALPWVAESLNSAGRQQRP